VSVALRLGGTRTEAERWSFLALALAAIGLAFSIWFILGSDSDPAGVLWWLVVAPLVVTAVPVLIPRHVVRVTAMAVLGAWCVLTGFSIGMLLLPALIAAVVAVVREGS
jgi:FtsH-binding integral membrane protein